MTERLANLTLIGSVAMIALVAFAVYRQPAMAFLLDSFRFCG